MGVQGYIYVCGDASSSQVSPTPATTDAIVSVAGSTVTVSWADVANETSYDVYLLQEPWSWYDVKYSQNVSANTTSCTFYNVAQGYYCAFIIARPNGDQVQGQWAGFTVAPPAAPVINALSSQNIYKNAPVTFTWGAVSGATSYWVLVIDPSGNEVVSGSVGANTSYTGTFSAVGTYYIVVTSVNNLGQSSSAPYYFDICNPTASPAVVQYYNGHIYELYYNYEKLTWENAKEYCENYRGGHLVTINDSAEQSFIANDLITSEKYGYFIGGTDRANEGTWTWITGEPFSYSNWEDGEPNNTAVLDQNGEDFLMIISSNGKWNDIINNNEHGFICEIESENFVPLASTVYNGHIYEVYNYNLAWGEAKNFCIWNGGHLVTVSDSGEQAVIYELLLSTDCNKYCWLGAICPNMDGNWKWEDETPFEYTNWKPGMPDYWQGEETCLMLYKEQEGLWNDVTWGYCFDHLDHFCFILEKELPHTHSYTLTSTVPASCTAAGLNTYTCSCGDSYTETIAATGHNYGDWSLTTAPDCLTEGTESRVCANDASHVETRPIPALGHVAGSPTTENIVDPGCLTAGSYDLVVYCQECGAELSREAIFIEALGHKWGEWEVTTPAKIDVEGVETRTCINCETTETRAIPAIIPEKAPTISEFSISRYSVIVGYMGSDIVYSCANASSVSFEIVSAASGETVSNGTRRQWYADGFFDDGNYTYIVYAENSVGSAEKSFNFTVKNGIIGPEETQHVHSYVSVVTKPTCTAGGFTTYTCSCGDSYIADETAAIGHSFGAWTLVTPATYEAEGVETRACTVCGTSENRAIPQLIPAWGDANGDGEVDILDAITVAQYTIDDSVELLYVADVNRDDEIDILDAITIAQYTIDDNTHLGPVE